MIKQLQTIQGSQTFNTSIKGVNYNFSIIWRGTQYCLNLLDTNKNPIITGIALVPGMDLLGPYQYLNLGFGLSVSTTSDPTHEMTYTDLGSISQIIIWN
jgi:hypothetical protein